MKEGSVLLIALLLTAATAWWSAEHPPAPEAPAETPTPAAAPVAPPPALASPMPPPPPAARPDQAYRCLRGGTPTFSDRPCAPGEAQEIITLRTPPSGTPTASYQEQYERLVADRPVVPAPRPSPQRHDEADQKTVECEHWLAVIRDIDTSMRQPLSGPMMDHFAARRRAAHDRRFTLGC